MGHDRAVGASHQLIVVSGAPGTGKTTTATALASALSLPLLSLDTIKETLADTLGLGGEDWSDQLGDAAAEVVFRLCREFPAIAEGWWRKDRRERAISEFAGAVEVFCRCDPEMVSTRMAERVQRDRHPIHRDVINPTLLESTAQVAAEVVPLSLGGPLVVVDTTTPPDLDRVAAEVRDHLGGLRR